MKVENLEIKKLGINGEGIGYIDRKITFVPGALPGEVVNVDVVKQTRSFYEAKVTKIVEYSENRIKESCSLNKDCLGCSLLHMKYPLQTQYKKEAIRESIRKYTSYDLSKTVFKDVIPPKNKQGFINEVNLPIVYSRGAITFGIYQRDSKFLTILSNCFKQDEKINNCLKELEKILTSSKCKSYSDKFKTGLRFLKVKIVDNKIQLVFITGKDGLDNEVVEKISHIDHVEGIFVSVNTTKHQEFDEVGYSKAGGSTRLEMDVDGKKIKTSIKSTIGENYEMEVKKAKEIAKLLENSKSVLSVNCGIGLVEMLSDKDFISLDEKNYHIEDAKLNAKYLNRDNIKFVKGDTDEKVVLYAKQKACDTFLIQNGRFGLTDIVKKSILLSKVKHIIISCESHSTLAKDLSELEKSYHLEKIVALDTHLYTPYVTTVVKLVRK